jgi:hypothetical protein
MALGPVGFVLCQADIYQVAGYGAFNKYHFPLYPCQRFAFGGIVFYPDLFQDHLFFLFSHGANVTIIRAGLQAIFWEMINGNPIRFDYFYCQFSVMRRFLLSAGLLLGISGLFAQAKPAGGSKPVANPAAAKGRNISITLTPLKNTKVYLGSYYGNSKVLADSAYLDEKSHGVFKGPTKLVPGIYFVVTPQLTIQFDLLMDKTQQFSIVADTSLKDKAVITGSVENDLYKSYAGSILPKDNTWRNWKASS